MIYNICDELINKEFKDTELAWITESDNYQEIKEEMVDILLDCVLEKQENVDFSNVIDKIIECVEEESEVIVDEVLDEIETLSEDFDARENEYVQSIVDTYSIEVSDEFYDEINGYVQYADNLDEYRDDIKEEIDTQIIEPVKEEKDNISAELNESLTRTLDDYYASEGFEYITFGNEAVFMLSAGINMVCIIFLAISLVFMLFICILYRRGIYGAFSKFAVITGINGVFLMLIGSVKNTVNSAIDSAAASEIAELEELIGDNAQAVIDKLMSGIFDPFMKVGIIYMIIMAVSIVIWVVGKIVYNRNLRDYTNMMNKTDSVNMTDRTDYTNLSGTINGTDNTNIRN